MTNEEKDLLVAYLVDAGEIDTDGNIEQQFLDWYQVRDQVASSEAHYKAILEAALVRQRSLERGVGVDSSITVRAPGRLRPRPPCGCYAEGHAVGMGAGYAKRRNDPLEDLTGVRRGLGTSTSRRSGYNGRSQAICPAFAGVRGECHQNAAGRGSAKKPQR